MVFGMIRRQIIFVMFVTAIIMGCNKQSTLDRSLDLAGDNRHELESVLNHYSDNTEKFAAAHFLIDNLPAHYSYAGAEIHEYYDYAARILADTALTPEQQRDSLLFITDAKYADLPNHTIPDAQIITADFLIDNIDKSYTQWTTCPWASHITFSEYLEWMLPYKLVEFQELDHWRDTMYTLFGASALERRIPNDVEYNNVIHVADTVRYMTSSCMPQHRLSTHGCLSLLSDYLQVHQTFGRSEDYSLTLALLLRSIGVPVMLDETPVGPRYSASTRWIVTLSERGEELCSEWDFSTVIGNGFFPYERGPKVYRNTYATNMDRQKYMRKSKYKYPFDLTVQDVTSHYFLTSDICIPVNGKVREPYVYIASAVRDDDNPWTIVDFAPLKHGKACFHDMGREVLYTVMGYNGKEPVPVTAPFILHKDGTMEYVNADTIQSTNLDKWKNYAL